MSEENNGANGGGENNDSAPPAESIEQRLSKAEANAAKHAATLQAAQEELKRVSGLNTVLMQRLNDPRQPNERGMDAGNTRPIKLKRDFSQIDPASDPARFAEEIVLETAEQVSSVMARDREQQASAQSLRAAFYGKNKDLVSYEIEVGHFSNEIQAQNPGLPFDQAAELIAARTREYLKSRNLATDNSGTKPPHTLPPSSGGDDGRVPIKRPDGSGTQNFDADKAYHDDMKDYANERNKERERLGNKRS